MPKTYLESSRIAAMGVGEATVDHLTLDKIDDLFMHIYVACMHGAL
jgi:hypothetical protein